MTPHDEADRAGLLDAEDGLRPGCVRCALERQAVDWVYRDELWSVGSFWIDSRTQQIGPSRTPGRLVLQSRRHAEGAVELNDEELATLGPLIGRVSRAIRAATGAEKVYFASIGEHSAHFHVALVPRSATIPADERGPGFLLHLPQYDNEPERAAQLAAEVRQALAAGRV